MRFEVKYLEDDEVVFSIIEGKLSEGELKEMLAEQSRMAVERECKLFLTDMTAGIPVQGAIDLFMFSKRYEEAGLPHNGKKAVVYSGDLSDVEFFEDALYNRGWNVRMFKDIDEAKAWLLGRGGASHGS